jgi:hypothetical protein
VVIRRCNLACALDLRQQFYTRKPCATACTLGCVRTQSAYDEWRAQPQDATSQRRLPLSPE